MAMKTDGLKVDFFLLANWIWRIYIIYDCKCFTL